MTPTLDSILVGDGAGVVPACVQPSQPITVLHRRGRIALRVGPFTQLPVGIATPAPSAAVGAPRTKMPTARGDLSHLVEILDARRRPPRQLRPITDGTVVVAARAPHGARAQQAGATATQGHASNRGLAVVATTIVTDRVAIIACFLPSPHHGITTTGGEAGVEARIRVDHVAIVTFFHTLVEHTITTDIVRPQAGL